MRPCNLVYKFVRFGSTSCTFISCLKWRHWVPPKRWQPSTPSLTATSSETVIKINTQQRPYRYELVPSCAHDCPVFLTLCSRLSLYLRENGFNRVRIFEKVIYSFKILNSLVCECEDNCVLESDAVQYGSCTTIPKFQTILIFSQA